MQYTQDQKCEDDTRTMQTTSIYTNYNNSNYTNIIQWKPKEILINCHPSVCQILRYRLTIK